MIVSILLSGCSDIEQLLNQDVKLSDPKRYIGKWAEETGKTGIYFTFNEDKSFEMSYKFDDFPGVNRVVGSWLTTELDIDGVKFGGIILYRHFTEMNGTTSYFAEDEKMKEEYIVGFYDGEKKEMLIKRADKNYFYNLKRLE